MVEERATGTSSKQAAGEFGSSAGRRAVSPGKEGTGHLGCMGSDWKPPECLRPRPPCCTRIPALSLAPTASFLLPRFPHPASTTTAFYRSPALVP